MPGLVASAAMTTTIARHAAIRTKHPGTMECSMSYARMHAPRAIAQKNVAGEANASIATPMSSIATPTNCAVRMAMRPDGIGRPGRSLESTRTSNASFRIMPAT